jgi:hypothetical protein
MLTRDWRVVKETPTKRILMRYCPLSDEVEICEEWLADAPIEQAAMEREAPLFGKAKDVKPLAVIPDSEWSRATREGWVNDQNQWAKWAKDADNRKVQI